MASGNLLPVIYLEFVGGAFSPPVPEGPVFPVAPVAPLCPENPGVPGAPVAPGGPAGPGVTVVVFSVFWHALKANIKMKVDKRIHFTVFLPMNSYLP